MKFSRRQVLGAAAVAGLTVSGIEPAAAQITPAFTLPMGWEGMLPGDGTILRHAFDVENTSLYPGWWHTGENWYLDFDGNSAGAPIYAVADGTVVFAGSDYPGRVVIIQHEGGTYSMYGHLDYALLVGEGDAVTRGQLIARVLDKTDGRSPSHCHFEIRSFLIESIVNGESPWYDYACGYMCPPGPGYWPMYSELLPTEVGWLNPLHVIYGRAYDSDIPTGAEVIVSQSGSEFPLRATRTSAPSGTVTFQPGDRLPLLEIATGEEATLETSADAYSVLCKVTLPTGDTAWIPAVRATDEYVQSDGRPATIRIDLLLG